VRRSRTHRPVVARRKTFWDGGEYTSSIFSVASGGIDLDFQWAHFPVGMVSALGALQGSGLPEGVTLTTSRFSPKVLTRATAGTYSAFDSVQVVAGLIEWEADDDFGTVPPGAGPNPFDARLPWISRNVLTDEIPQSAVIEGDRWVEESNWTDVIHAKAQRKMEHRNGILAVIGIFNNTQISGKATSWAYGWSCRSMFKLP